MDCYPCFQPAPPCVFFPQSIPPTINPNLFPIGPPMLSPKLYPSMMSPPYSPNASHIPYQAASAPFFPPTASPQAANVSCPPTVSPIMSLSPDMSPLPSTLNELPMIDPERFPGASTPFYHPTSPVVSPLPSPPIGGFPMFNFGAYQTMDSPPLSPVYVIPEIIKMPQYQHAYTDQPYLNSPLFQNSYSQNYQRSF